MYLADTNVISAGAPSRLASPGIVAWMDAHSAMLFLSAVTVAEIEDGIARLRRDGATRKSDNLGGWLEALLHLYSARILAFDTPTARIAGALSDRARGQGHAPGLADIIIAATARHHGLTILSRNIRHFAPLDVPVLDPFATLPKAWSPGSVLSQRRAFGETHAQNPISRMSSARVTRSWCAVSEITARLSSRREMLAIA